MSYDKFRRRVDLINSNNILKNVSLIKSDSYSK